MSNDTSDVQSIHINTIDTLRKHLFDTLTALQDKENPMDIARARAVSEVAQVIINTAKVEVDNAKATGNRVSAFLLGNDAAPSDTALTYEQGHTHSHQPGHRRYVDGKLVRG